MLSLATTNAFTPNAAAAMAPARSSVHMAVDSMLGKYAITDIVFDPLNLSTKYDLNWLREAELKCAPPAAAAEL